MMTASELIDEITLTLQEKISASIALTVTGGSAYAQATESLPIKPDEFYFNPSYGIAIGAAGVLMNIVFQAYKIYESVNKRKREERERDEAAR